MSKVQMRAAISARFEEGFVARGGVFTAANEENARLYEERGLARKVKDKRPERIQDVGTADVAAPDAGMPPAEDARTREAGERRSRKTRRTKE